MIDYLLSSLVACSRAAAGLDYDTAAELGAAHQPLPSGCF